MAAEGSRWRSNVGAAADSVGDFSDCLNLLSHIAQLLHPIHLANLELTCRALGAPTARREQLRRLSRTAQLNALCAPAGTLMVVHPQGAKDVQQAITRYCSGEMRSEEAVGAMSAVVRVTCEAVGSAALLNCDKGECFLALWPLGMGPPREHSAFFRAFEKQRALATPVTVRSMPITDSAASVKWMLQEPGTPNAAKEMALDGLFSNVPLEEEEEEDDLNEDGQFSRGLLEIYRYDVDTELFTVIAARERQEEPRVCKPCCIFLNNLLMSGSGPGVRLLSSPIRQLIGKDLLVFHGLFSLLPRKYPGEFPVRLGAAHLMGRAASLAPPTGVEEVAAYFASESRALRQWRAGLYSLHNWLSANVGRWGYKTVLMLQALIVQIFKEKGVNIDFQTFAVFLCKQCIQAGSVDAFMCKLDSDDGVAEMFAEYYQMLWSYAQGLPQLLEWMDQAMLLQQYMMGGLH
eukprot:gene12094-14292_t